MTRFECRILLVDDEAELLEMVGGLLMKEGYRQVDRAADCKEALRCTRENEYQLVLLDVMLPDGDGFALLEQLRRLKGSGVLFSNTAEKPPARYPPQSAPNFHRTWQSGRFCLHSG